MEKITLPICIPYLKEKSTGPHNFAQLALSLFGHLSQIHFPSQENSRQICYSLLKAISSEELPAPEQIEMVQGISCRKIQNLLYCRTICPACPYSASYQNRFETEEGLILSYILQDYSNFACMFSSPLKPSFFKSVFYCRAKDSFFVFPLHGSLYEYMLGNYHLGSQRNQLLRNYFVSLKEETGQRIIGQPQELVQAYINNLIKNGKTVSIEHVNMAVQTIQSAKKQAHAERKSPAPSSQAAGILQPSAISLDYMLSADTKVKKAPSAPDLRFKELSAFLVSQAEIVPSSEKPDVPKISSPAASVMTDFHFSINDLAGYEYYSISPSSPAEVFELLENKLLISPYISLEGGYCMDDEQDYILLYMDECYFVFSPSCHRAIQLVSSVIKRKSALRKFISFDGYYISWLLFQQGILPVHLFSIHQTFRFQHRTSAVKQERTPEELITLLENRQNLYGLSFYCYAMKYYPNIYQQLNSIPAKELPLYDTDRYFHQLLGISYYLPSTKTCSFNIDGLGALTYSFPDLKSDIRFTVVHFKIEVETFSGESVLDLILKPALAALYRSQLCLQSSLNLIFLSEDEIRLSFLKEYISSVTEAIHMLLSYYGECVEAYIKVTECIFT